MYGIQLELFDTEQANDLLSEVLVMGSGMQGGELRIYGAATRMKKADFVAFLKDEFYYYGFGHGDLSGDASPRGYKLRRDSTNEERLYTWKEVADGYLKLIARGLFPSNEVLEAFSKIPAGEVPRARYGYPSEWEEGA